MVNGQDHIHYASIMEQVLVICQFLKISKRLKNQRKRIFQDQYLRLLIFCFRLKISHLSHPYCSIFFYWTTFKRLPYKITDLLYLDNDFVTSLSNNCRSLYSLQNILSISPFPVTFEKTSPRASANISAFAPTINMTYGSIGF